MKNILHTIILSFLFSSSVFAGDEAGLDAYKKGDYETAYKEWKALAEQGDAEAQTNLGLMYDNGQGVTQDDKEAVKWYRLAAEQGDADAQFNLGVMYENGQGVTQDDKESVKWYRLAAEQEHVLAGHQLGVMYHYGQQGVKTNYKEALRFYRLAAPQVVQSQYSLGVMYYQGQGVDQDIVIAYMWFYVAAENGNPRSKGNINVLAKEMKPKQIAKAEKLARECVEKNYKDCG